MGPRFGIVGDSHVGVEASPDTWQLLCPLVPLAPCATRRSELFKLFPQDPGIQRGPNTAEPAARPGLKPFFSPLLMWGGGSSRFGKGRCLGCQALGLLVAFGFEGLAYS